MRVCAHSFTRSSCNPSILSPTDRPTHRPTNGPTWKAKGQQPGEDALAWDEVVHFVILPNYKEDIDILREAIDTLAISTVARGQMGIVLAMEAREAGSREKASASSLVVSSVCVPPRVVTESRSSACSLRTTSSHFFLPGIIGFIDELTTDA